MTIYFCCYPINMVFFFSKHLRFCSQTLMVFGGFLLLLLSNSKWIKKTKKTRVEESKYQ